MAPMLQVPVAVTSVSPSICAQPVLQHPFSTSAFLPKRAPPAHKDRQCPFGGLFPQFFLSFQILIEGESLHDFTERGSSIFPQESWRARLLTHPSGTTAARPEGAAQA